MTEAIAAHIPPADAPEKTSIETSWRGTGCENGEGGAGLERCCRNASLAFCHSSSASTKKSRTPAVYAPAEIAPAMLMPILNSFVRQVKDMEFLSGSSYEAGRER